MDNLEEVEMPDAVKLSVTEEIRSYIYETTKWTRFLSIVGFVVSVLIILTAFSIGSLLNSTAFSTPEMAQMVKMGGPAMTVILFLYALMIFYPSMLLFKYSNSARKAVLYGDQQALAISAEKLKAYFKFWGILTIIFIALYVLFFLLVITGTGISG